MTTIEIQKEIGAEVLRKLQTYDKGALIAGGAPRDWEMGNTCKDIDIYIRALHSTIGFTQDFLTKLGILDANPMYAVNKDTCGEGYLSMRGLSRVWNVIYKGQEVQIMEIEDTSTSVPDMDAAICQFYITNPDTMEIQGTPAAKFCLDNNINLLSYEGCRMKHYTKMRQRFPTFLPITIQDKKYDAWVEDIREPLKDWALNMWRGFKNE